MDKDEKKAILLMDEQYMQEAIRLAEHANRQGEVPVGAVVVLEEEIIGKGWNQPIANHDPTAHAEIVALRDAAKTVENYRLVNTTLYVTLEPCLMCVGAMLHARVKRVVFAAYDPKTGAAGSVFNVLADAGKIHVIRIQGGVLEKQGADLLKTFFRSRR